MGEQPLMGDGSCNLGSINLNAFVRNPFTSQARFDFKRFKEVTQEMTWGLDELLTLLGNRHALKGQRDHVEQWREIGLGVMGMADLALSMNVAYGSDEFIVIVDEIMDKMINWTIQASSLRAKDLGSFPMYNEELILKSTFIQAVAWDETIEMIKKYGLRNSRLLSVAPTGTISNLCGVSGGVEPFFMIYYNREIQSMFEDKVVIQVVEKTPLALMKHLGITDADELPDYAKVTSQNIDFESRAKVQATLQKYIDTAISSTFNVPNHASVQDIIDIYITAWKYGLKGATVFRNNCKKSGILSGGNEDYKDMNPATPPTFDVTTIIEQKSPLGFATGVKEANVETITIKDTGYDSKVIAKDVCPECGSPLEKRGGCTACSNNECHYEKCAV